MNLKGALSILALSILCYASALAQSSTEYNSDNASPYSRYGIGTLMPRNNGFNTSMGGAGLALRSGRRINTANPASYAAIDSVTFLCDLGMSLDRQTFKYNGVKQDQNISRLSYANVAFRLTRGLGLSAGYMPISSIGYDYMTNSHVGWSPNTNQEVRTTNSYWGTGGLHQVYLGIGYSPVRGLSLGVNGGFLWGEYQHKVTQAFTEGSAVSSVYNSQITTYSADLTSYSVDFGIQYELNLGAKNTVGIGTTVGIGHKINSTATFQRTSSTSDEQPVSKAFELPMTYAVGLAYTYANKWRVAADFELQQWGDCTCPHLVTIGNKATYVADNSMYMDRKSIRVGGEYCPHAISRSYLKRVNYRVGAFYNTPYVRINGMDGPKEYGVTAGVSLPITNGINNRSVVNIGVRWTRIEPSVSSLMSENQLSLTLGLTFNEQWFMKWKIR